MQQMTSDGLAYLTSPYSHPDKMVRHVRAHNCVQYLAALAAREQVAYSPIWHWHKAAVMYDLPTDVDWWWQNNLIFMKASALIIVAEMPGWRESKGVGLELNWAKTNGKPVMYCHQDNDFVLTTGPIT